MDGWVPHTSCSFPSYPTPDVHIFSVYHACCTHNCWKRNTWIEPWNDILAGGVWEEEEKTSVLQGLLNICIICRYTMNEWFSFLRLLFASFDPTNITTIITNITYIQGCILFPKIEFFYKSLFGVVEFFMVRNGNFRPNLVVFEQKIRVFYKMDPVFFYKIY